MERLRDIIAGRCGIGVDKDVPDDQIHATIRLTITEDSDLGHRMSPKERASISSFTPQYRRIREVVSRILKTSA